MRDSLFGLWFWARIARPAAGASVDPSYPKPVAVPEILVELIDPALFVTFYDCAHDTGFRADFVEFTPIVALMYRECCAEPSAARSCHISSRNRHRGVRPSPATKRRRSCSGSWCAGPYAAW